jgi:hypothetical protein
MCIYLCARVCVCVCVCVEKKKVVRYTQASVTSLLRNGQKGCAKLQTESGCLFPLKYYSNFNIAGNIPEDSHLHSHHCENPKSQILKMFHEG